jgi:hypothetical protein
MRSTSCARRCHLDTLPPSSQVHLRAAGAHWKVHTGTCSSGDEAMQEPQPMRLQTVLNGLGGRHGGNVDARGKFAPRAALLAPLRLAPRLGQCEAPMLVISGREDWSRRWPLTRAPLSATWSWIAALRLLPPSGELEPGPCQIHCLRRAEVVALPLLLWACYRTKVTTQTKRRGLDLCARLAQPLLAMPLQRRCAFRSPSS